jgi:hypothetical protein
MWLQLADAAGVVLVAVGAGQGLDQPADVAASAHRLPRRLSQEAASGYPV